MNKIVSRSEAARNGIARYYTGKPCKHGHVCERQVTNGCCIECATQIRLRYRANNPDKVREANRSYKSSRPEWAREQNRKHYNKNKKQVLKRNREYALANLDIVRAASRRFKERHPERAMLDKHVRRARLAGAEGKYTSEDLRRIRTAQRNKCAYCRSDLKISCHVDHIYPLAKGGSNYARNIQFLCGPCNVAKNSKDPIDYMQSKGMLL